jgi:hypothetical protein
VNKVDFLNREPMRVCVVSANKAFAELLAYEIGKMGHLALSVGDLAAAQSSDCAFWVVDLDGLPKGTVLPSTVSVLGYSVCRAGYGLEELGAGCEMLLHKPFLMSDFRESLNSLVSLAKKVTPFATVTRSADNDRVYLDEISRVAVVCGESVSLSEKEYAALSLLLLNRGRAVSRAELAAEIGCEKNAQEVDVYVCYLRRKIDDRLNFKFIRAVRGVGYTIN